MSHGLFGSQGGVKHACKIMDNLELFYNKAPIKVIAEQSDIFSSFCDGRVSKLLGQLERHTQKCAL
jgi:hypothetical protein